MAKYTAISEVPRRWRTLGDGQLTLQQIQQLVDTAEARASETGKEFAVTHHRARIEFQETHHVVDGWWVEQQEN